MDLMEKFNGKIIDYVFDNSGVPCALLIKCNNCNETVACMSDAATVISDCIQYATGKSASNYLKNTFPIGKDVAFVTLPGKYQVDGKVYPLVSIRAACTLSVRDFERGSIVYATVVYQEEISPDASCYPALKEQVERNGEKVKDGASLYAYAVELSCSVGASYVSSRGYLYGKHVKAVVEAITPPNMLILKKVTVLG